MKKMVIALILMLPLMFLFVVFSAANAGSINVDISVNGIYIQNKPEGDTLYIDLATYAGDYKVEALVTPYNAKNRGYSYSVESSAEGTQTADVRINDLGQIEAYSLGSAKVVVTSNDGGYTDSIYVVVNSSGVLGVTPYLYSAADADMTDNLVQGGDGKYTASVSTGKYYYRAVPYPATAGEVTVTTADDEVIADVASRTLLFPFAGEYEVLFSFDDDGRKLTSAVRFEVSAVRNESGILVNGQDSAVIDVDSDERKGKAYISLPSGGGVSLTGSGAEYISYYEFTRLDTDDRYMLEFTLKDNAPDTLTLGITSGGATNYFTVNTGEFSFSVTTDLPVQTGDSISVLADSGVRLFAVANTFNEKTNYVWEIIGKHNGASLVYDGRGTECVLYGGSAGESYRVECTAYRNGVALDIPTKTVYVSVVNKVSSVAFNDEKPKGLGNITAIAQYKFDGSLNKIANTYYFDIVPYDVTGGNPALTDFDITCDNSSIADISIVSGKVRLNIKMTGKVTVTAAWKGNASYGADVTAKYSFIAVAGGVEVYDSDQLYKAAGSGDKIVLRQDVMLGTDSDGNPYSLEQRTAMLGTMISTYNTEYLKQTGKPVEVSYAIEFKNDVYGNGNTVNAEYFAKAEDSTGKPLIFKEALALIGAYVEQNKVMQISGQDNVSFLVRTDGITISNVTLLGCSDEKLLEGSSYDLNKLNYTGTVLDVNADCKILNCRIRNGKNNIRVFGGNRNGNEFFVQNAGGAPVSDSDRIIVEIDGCIISQAREFLLKTGANRAVKSYGEINEPDLLDALGKAYSPFDDLTRDNYFYDRYVLTDITVRNCVFEKSGLFSIGMESNFSGGVLNEDKLNEYGFDFTNGWGIGGTLYGSILRLEGDVRFYDWKILDNIDSSTLVEIQPDSIFAQFALNVSKMFECVVAADDKYSALFTEGEDGEKYVNSAIVKYGGGKNFAQLDVSGLDVEYADYGTYSINVSVLKTSSDEELQKQGEYFPIAAGTQDFLFYIYDAHSANSLQKQLADYASGNAYKGVVSVYVSQ